MIVGHTIFPDRDRYSIKPSPSEMTVLENGTVVTADGLALKGSDAIEIINVRLENRLDAPFYSWQVCRIVRRDFNFVATKFFHRESQREGGREQVRSLVHEVRLRPNCWLMSVNRSRCLSKAQDDPCHSVSSLLQPLAFSGHVRSLTWRMQN